jgi:hypothetical protein
MINQRRTDRVSATVSSCPPACVSPPSRTASSCRPNHAFALALAAHACMGGCGWTTPGNVIDVPELMLPSPKDPTDPGSAKARFRSRSRSGSHGKWSPNRERERERMRMLTIGNHHGLMAGWNHHRLFVSFGIHLTGYGNQTYCYKKSNGQFDINLLLIINNKKNTESTKETHSNPANRRPMHQPQRTSRPLITSRPDMLARQARRTWRPPPTSSQD